MESRPKNSELKAAIFDAIGPQLDIYGFKLRRAKGRFDHSDVGATDFFQLVCLDGKPGVRVQPNVGVRIELVEQIFHKTSGFDHRYQKDTATIGSAVGNILNGDNRTCEFFLGTEADVRPSAGKIVTVFKEFALPYFKRYASLDEIDAELNNHPTQHTLSAVGQSVPPRVDSNCTTLRG